MIKVDVMSRVPIYEQIINQIKRMISLGFLKAGDKLESVRSLSMTISVNPNTIQKAYNELCTTNIAISVPGRGYFISNEAPEIIRNSNMAMLDKLCDQVLDLTNLGIDKDMIIEHLKKKLNG